MNKNEVPSEEDVAVACLRFGVFLVCHSYFNGYPLFFAKDINLSLQFFRLMFLQKV